MAGILIKNAKIILQDKIINGSVYVENHRILKIGTDYGSDIHPDIIIDLNNLYLSPGFIETHVHGGGMSDFSDGTFEAYEKALNTHLEHGATAICPTLIGTSREEIEKSIMAFVEIQSIMEHKVFLPGLHLEGPYLSLRQKGALPEQFLRDPDPVEYKYLSTMAGGVIKRWTFAPERNGAIDFVDYLISKDIIPSIGHSDAEYCQVLEAFRHGCHLITHLYSAMSTIVRREGFRISGVLESAFCIDGMISEVIADGAHIPLELLHMVWRLIGDDHVILTTDASRCAGTDAKRATIGSLDNGIPIIVEDGVAKLLDRSAFGGSIATPERLIHVMWKKAGIPLESAVKMYTSTPAAILGISNRKGCISEGMDADFVCFDDSVTIKGIMTRGYVSGIFKGEE